MNTDVQVSANAPRRDVGAWLLACAALVFCILVVGGVTRLTHSGLSIVEWQPLVGTLPPLTDADWQAVFAKYQQTPEFKLVNHQMGLDEFKGIFWWEYAHRLFGRGIGLAFALPFLWFWWRGRIDRALAPRLVGIFILGGLQGAMGWYMVKSGLVDDPRVSQFRLTAHLSIAFVIFAALFWVGLGLCQPRARASKLPSAARGVRAGALAALLGVAYMVVTGGFVAGIRAGKAYNTFPLMNGAWIPPEIWLIEPWYRNFFYNMATVQFDHRLGAWVLALGLPWLWLAVRRQVAAHPARIAANILMLAFAAQITLGIMTLLHAVPVALGAAHQGGAMVVFATTLYLNHRLRIASK